MFGLSWGELFVIAVVALVVLGPERLPVVARWIGRTVARTRAFVENAKTELAGQIPLEELRELKADWQQTATSLRSEMHQNLHQIEAQMADLRRETASGSPASGIPAWDRLPPLRTPADFNTDGTLKDSASDDPDAAPALGFAPRTPNRRRLQQKRAHHPAPRPVPKLRSRRPFIH